MDEKAVLVDLSWVYHRAWHAYHDLSFEGKQTGAIYGTLRDLQNLHKRFPQAHVYVALEPETNDERYKLCPTYKAGRGKGYDVYEFYNDTLSAIKHLKYCVMVSSEQDGEADDIIYSLADEYKDSYKEMVIHGIDNDLFQCGNLDSKIKILSAVEGRKDRAYIPIAEACYSKFGIQPSGVLMYRSIVGDSSDNLPTVSRRFPRAEVRKIVEGYPNIEEYLAVAPESKYRTRLLENKEQWFKNYRMMQSGRNCMKTCSIQT